MLMKEMDVFSHGLKKKKNLLQKFSQAILRENVKLHAEWTQLVTAALQYVYRDFMVIVALSHR